MRPEFGCLSMIQGIQSIQGAQPKTGTIRPTYQTVVGRNTSSIKYQQQHTFLTRIKRIHTQHLSTYHFWLCNWWLCRSLILCFSVNNGIKRERERKIKKTVVVTIGWIVCGMDKIVTSIVHISAKMLPLLSRCLMKNALTAIENGIFHSTIHKHNVVAMMRLSGTHFIHTNNVAIVCKNHSHLFRSTGFFFVHVLPLVLVAVLWIGILLSVTIVTSSYELSFILGGGFFFCVVRYLLRKRERARHHVWTIA